MEDLKVISAVDKVPEGKNITESRMVYKRKLTSLGDVEKWKARLVAKGFSQQYGVDWNENFAPTPQIAGIRLLIVFILHFGLMHASGDVSGAFLNSTLTEEIYLRLPEGLKLHGSTIVLLLKALYGLKQAANEWHALSDKIIREFDPELKQSKSEPCIYYKITKDCIFVLSVHVDDYLFGYNSKEYMQGFVAHFNKTIKMTVQPSINFILQMKLEWSDNSVTLSQNRQIEALVNKFGVNGAGRTYKTPMDGKALSDPTLRAGDPKNLPDVPYRGLVCALLFIARYTRPDIMFAVCFLCRYLSNYTDAHWKAAKRILIYLKNTTDIKLKYTKIPNAKPLEVYTDSDWAGCQESRRSTSGGVIFAYGNPVAWYSEKQGCVTGSSSEAEYVALNSALKEGNYFINLMQQEMGIKITPAAAHIDNIGAGFMAEQKICNKRSKHIDIKYHYCREQVQEFKNFDLNYVPTGDNVSDIFTKPLDAPVHHKHRNSTMKWESQDSGAQE
jgi:hypothetical protein